MTALLEIESTVTARYQTTIPAAVRHALRIARGGKLHYTLQPDGSVVLAAVAPDAQVEDPALLPFLALLGQDIAAHPERLQPLGTTQRKRLQKMVSKVRADLDAALSPDDE